MQPFATLDADPNPQTTGLSVIGLSFNHSTTGNPEEEMLSLDLQLSNWVGSQESQTAAWKYTSPVLSFS